VKLAVFGATGGVGREVVTQALDPGPHVTAENAQRKGLRQGPRYAL
jgi:uncharacterized protein YbjT (DUF2867 family)